MAKGDKPVLTRTIEIGGISITYGMVIIQCLSLFNILPTLHIGNNNEMIGITIAFIGVLFFISALIAMKNSWRAGIDSSQKTIRRTGGILRHSRNPAFVGFNLFYIGIALVVPNVLLFVAVIVAFAFFHLQILEEEKFLSKIFGEDYLKYKQKVRRYI